MLFWVRIPNVESNQASRFLTAVSDATSVFPTAMVVIITNISKLVSSQSTCRNLILVIDMWIVQIMQCNLSIGIVTVYLAIELLKYTVTLKRELCESLQVLSSFNRPFQLVPFVFHFRPRDATRGNSFFQMSSYARANLRITNEKTKRKFP